MKTNLIVILSFILPNLLLGQFHFKEKSNTGLPNWYGNFIVPIDFDADLDKDVLISGTNSYGQLKTQLYENDGYCHFTLNPTFYPSSPIVQSAKVADFNKDGRPDLLLLEQDSTQQQKAYIYLNSSTHTFTPYPIDISSYPYITKTFIEDVNNDTYPDVVFTGSSTHFLINDHSMNFVSNDTSIFNGTSIYYSAFADFDQDGDQDLVRLHSQPQLFTNDGFGFFSLQPNALPQISSISMPEIADFNNDSFPDILYLENNAGIHYPKILTNQGNATFTQTYVGVGLMDHAKIFIDDANLDGNQDVFFSVVNQPTPPKLIAFEGTGTDELSYTKLELFDQLGGAISLFDCDQDSDSDFMMMGYQNSSYQNKIYVNDAIVGIKEPVENFLQVYPNPSPNLIHLQNTSNQPIQLHVFSVAGNKVHQTTLQANELKTWESNLLTGMYVIQIYSSNEVKTQKVVIR